MNSARLEGLLDQALRREITFPEILKLLAQEEVESYHVDFLRKECRYYSRQGDSLAVPVGLDHDGVATEFSAERLAAINARVQGGEAGYADFVRAGAAAGYAYYIVYLYGKMVRYFGRDGGEHIQYFPGGL